MSVHYPNRQALIDAGYPADWLDAAIRESERRDGSRGVGPSAGQPIGRRAPSYVPGVMNVTEARFAAFLDAGRWPHGTVTEWAYERDKLILSPDMTLLIDFTLTLDDNSLIYVDTKGAGVVRDDSVAKLKAASVLYPSKCYLAILRSGAWNIRQVGVAKRRTIKVKA